MNIGRKRWYPLHRAILELTRNDWWDAMAQFLKRTKSRKEFIDRVAAVVWPWKVRLKFISELAWNDMNSEWNIQYHHIVATWTFDDGESVTPEAVAESVLNVLENQ